MGKVLTREEAWELLNEYNKEPFHLRHGETVEGVMRYLAQELGYGDEEMCIRDRDRGCFFKAHIQHCAADFVGNIHIFKS